MWLMAVSRFIDAINTRIGKLASWLILISILIGAGNAIARKFFGFGSNAYLEAQWYLFSAVFLLCAAWALCDNEHVKVDLLYSNLSRRKQLIIEIFGTIFFLFPFCFLVVYLSYPIVVDKIASGEMSSNPGGLIRWPVWLLMPVGFALVWLQGVSEIIKRVFILTGKIDDPKDVADQAAEAALAFDMADVVDDDAAIQSGHKTKNGEA